MKFCLIIFSTLIVFASCSKNELEITPTDKLSDATVWEDSATANLFLNDIYFSLNAGPFPNVFTALPSEISNDPLDDFTDNTTYGPSSGLASAQYLDNGSNNPTTSMFQDTWTKMYANIRKCNLFIQKVTGTDFPDGTKNRMIAQARFLRVHFYRTLIDLYGGVPLITKVLDNNTGDDIFFARNTYEECVAFVQTECAEASNDLPLTVTGKNIGRATKGAALALKGEAELYAGKWPEAAATNKKIIDEMGNGKVYDLFPDYVGLFYANNENNKEVLFDIQFAPTIKSKSINQYWGVVDVAKGAGWGSCDPTQNLVDDYEFTDGKTAAGGSVLYDPSKPYLNSEKRFYASIIYDGCTWRGKTVFTRLGIANNANQINLTGITGNAGRTGYFVRKLQDSTIGSTGGVLDGTNVIMLRYAEVLLNYAEAQNEAQGPDASVYDAINKVRARAGQPALPPGLGQTDMRNRIRHERRIEFAFEGKRFYDIMRWKTAAQVFSQPIYGMKITASGNTLNYEKVVVRNVKFDAAKGYLQPVPQYARDKNPKLTQNPGFN
ncbi:MAG TPA: RagB/SusD family nutrient uptake outer membrane protein [Flavitalea sp.]|nr:RagB/SusD family nutrient uptake outer membrane protein [Flavitalea sp.]